MATWPASLPQNFNAKNFTRQAREQTIESETDIGPPKRRRRSAYRTDLISGQMVLDFAQADTLDDFWQNVTKGGIAHFEWDRLGQGVETYRFLSAPKFTYPGGYVRAEVELERM